MKTWEQTEFEAQQESIKKWAKKKLEKIMFSWWMKRRLRKVRELAAIITNDPEVIIAAGCNKYSILVGFGEGKERIEIHKCNK